VFCICCFVNYKSKYENCCNRVERCKF